MISVHEALTSVLNLVQPLGSEVVHLTGASGRVLSKNVSATRNQPPFRSSAMDGYAISKSDFLTGEILDVIGESAAGSRFAGTVSKGQAVRIFTGGVVPDGADKILIQEDVTVIGTEITIQENADTATYIRPIGGDFKIGDQMATGTLLGSSEIALLAAMNIANVPVHRKPIVCLIATGDELVVPGNAPNSDQIIASNNYGLKALFESYGATVRLLPIASDTEDSLINVLSLCEGSDLIITLGGASVGDHDLVRKVAEQNGLETAFYKVAMRPGKPLMAGRYNGIPMVGLPGNPVSSMVCGHVFCLPAIHAMQGLPKAALETEVAELSRDIPENGPRAHYMRATVNLVDGHQICTPFDRQDSSLISVLVQANALLVRKPNDPALKQKNRINFIRL